MPQWIRPRTRWALYMRDDFECLYCGITLQELLADTDGGFLVVDHVVPQAKGGNNAPSNLMTSCYACNLAKGLKSIAAFCREYNYSESKVRHRLYKRRRKSVDHYRVAVDILFGNSKNTPFVQPAEFVPHHDWRVRRQWGESIDSDYWEHLSAQAHLFCPVCTKPSSQLSASLDLSSLKEAEFYLEPDELPF